MNDDKLSWKEKFAAIIVLLIGILYLANQVMNIVSSKTSAIYSEGDKWLIRKSELISDVKTYITIILAITGGILLFKKKQWGWIMSVPILMLVAVFMGSGLVLLLYTFEFNIFFIALLIALLANLLSIVFLFLPGARKKYRVGIFTFIPTLVFLLALMALYFLLK